MKTITTAEARKEGRVSYENGFEDGEARGLECGLAAGRLHYMGEVCRIIEGATRNDLAKVRAYAELLAEKLEADGEASTAANVRKIASGNAGARIVPHGQPAGE